MKLLDGRVALVTGASRGIGRAVAKMYADSGAYVLALSRSHDTLHETVDDISRRGGRADAIIADLADPSAANDLAARILQQVGKLDILVANAAMLGPMARLAETDGAAWEEVFNLNLHGNFRLVKALDPLLQESDAGRAIFVSSGVARTCKAGWGAYAASKAALEALAKIYANETIDTNLRVNVVDPGRVRTAMRAAAYPYEDSMTLPAPEDMTGVFLELASPQCAHHGETLKA